MTHYAQGWDDAIRAANEFSTREWGPGCYLTHLIGKGLDTSFQVIGDLPKGSIFLHAAEGMREMPWIVDRREGAVVFVDSTESHTRSAIFFGNTVQVLWRAPV